MWNIQRGSLALAGVMCLSQEHGKAQQQVAVTAPQQVLTVDWTGNANVNAELSLLGARTSVDGFDGSAHHWFRTAKDDAKLWFALKADGAGLPEGVKFGTLPVMSIRFDTGNVGIGTYSPEATAWTKLHVRDGGIRVDGTYAGFLAGPRDLTGESFLWYNPTGDDLRLWTGTTGDIVSFDLSGRMGIGTNAPAAPLHVLRTTSGAKDMLYLENNGDARIAFQDTSNGAESNPDWQLIARDTSMLLYSNVGTEYLRMSNFTGDFTWFGDGTDSDIIAANGNFVAGVTQLNVPDYVFEPDYALKPLSELAEFIAREKHLPNIPSAADIKKSGGLNMTEIQLKLLEKIEELTLYTLAQERQIKELENGLGDGERLKVQLEERDAQVAALQNRVESLEHMTAERLAGLEARLATQESRPAEASALVAARQRLDCRPRSIDGPGGDRVPCGLPLVYRFQPSAWITGKAGD
jgi:hypothetical protein